MVVFNTAKPYAKAKITCRMAVSASIQSNDSKLRDEHEVPVMCLSAWGLPGAGFFSSRIDT